MKILVADKDLQTYANLIRATTKLADCTILQPLISKGDQVVQLVEKLLPDVLLLSFDLDNIDGLQVAAQLCTHPNAPAIIFCLDSQNQQASALQENHIKHLLKPITGKQLHLALTQAQRLTPAQLIAFSRTPQTLNIPRTYLSARTYKGLELIPFTEVIYCIADNKYVTLRHSRGETLLDESLKSLHQEFGEQLVRIHRNALVSRKHIDYLQRTDNGQHVLYLRGVTNPLSISRRHVAAIRTLIHSLKNLDLPHEVS
ncbi:LytTR family DNA-binding domain-containing protein [Denitrificimonas sp. JX-1]|uniref:LytTR family DNA-binding domain-containing protein n=1 Tax=Denitrificimonas halotolerans TaxID=3098930 RepID=A0ABU5GMX9_9GAMM|nr:LytTR family DNA-binding domain-containing protein [Denitrificimonas sp. JX-1]MDY7218319.1 LytTR family DNA-binding domain-containing protein [Denitrificimonas sp. JX-1]